MLFFWIQIHDLPLELMSETMAKHFGAFLGEFMKYDTHISSLGLQRYMRIKVRLDVRLTFKRRKKIQVGDQSYYTRFQYEKFSLFCFIYDKLGLEESFCLIRVFVDP